MNIIIKGTNLELTEAIKNYANLKIFSVEKFYPGIISIKIELERTTRHHQKGALWRAEANAIVPRRLIRAEATDKDLYAAIDAVKDELKREFRAIRAKTRTKRLRQSRARIN